MSSNNKPPVKPIAEAAALTALLLLAACGGGGSSSAGAGGSGGGGGGGGGGGTLTISSATPAVHNTTLDTTKAITLGNNTRAADGFSSQPYCEIFFEGITAPNGQPYAVQVYFRQSDKAVLNANVVGGNPPTFVVFENNAGNPITAGVTVDTATRTLTFTNKVLSGSSGEVGTVDGAVGFPANTTTPACGS